MTKTSVREPSKEKTGLVSGANDIPMGSSDMRITNSRRSSSFTAGDATADGSTQPDVTRYNPKHALKLLAPVSSCMILVSLHSKFVLQHKYLDAYAPYLMFKQEEQTGWDTLWKSMIVAAIFVGLIIAVTSLIVFAYFMKWYKAILVVIMLNCFLLFSLLTFDLLNSIVTIYNIHGDYITLALFMYNYGALGMMSIFWTAPLMIQQGHNDFVNYIGTRDFAEKNFWILLSSSLLSADKC